MQHSRNYSYDDHSANYPTSAGHNSTQHDASYSTSTHTYHRGASYDHSPTSDRYYVPSQSSGHGGTGKCKLSTTHYCLLKKPQALPPDPYYPRAMTPAIASGHRYQSPTYYASPGAVGPSSSSHHAEPAYPPQNAYYAAQYGPAQQRGHHSSQSTQQHFIPTPSELHSYSSYPRQISVTPGPQSPTLPPDPYSSPEYPPAPHHIVPSSLTSGQRPARISTGRPRTGTSSGTSPTSASSPPGERFPCERCGKTFSRAHDRKRHHETQHLQSPVVHRCRYCEKEFSRCVDHLSVIPFPLRFTYSLILSLVPIRSRGI